MIHVAFALSLLALIFKATLYPTLPILPFAPFLALLSLLKKLEPALLWAAMTGFGLDLLSNDPFGITAVGYTLTVLLAYRFRALFSAETPLHLAVYTALTSFICTQLHLVLLFLFDRRIEFFGKWSLVQWILLPLFDAVFASIWFVGPLMLVRKLHKLWVVYWLKKNTQE